MPGNRTDEPRRHHDRTGGGEGVAGLEDELPPQPAAVIVARTTAASAAVMEPRGILATGQYFTATDRRQGPGKSKFLKLRMRTGRSGGPSLRPQPDASPSTSAGWLSPCACRAKKPPGPNGHASERRQADDRGRRTPARESIGINARRPRGPGRRAGRDGLNGSRRRLS